MSNFLKLTANINSNQSVLRAALALKCQTSGQNPFNESCLSNENKKNNTTNLFNLLKSGNLTNINSNAFLHAAIIRDPYALKGLTSQIRIA